MLLNFSLLFCVFLDFNLNGSNATIEIIKASTPPNLFGIERKIAYANRKYHSGWIWGGVLIGLAGEKFSGSINRYGLIIFININNIITNAAINRSFEEKKGWNGILSFGEFKPRGFLDFSSCKKIKCSMTKTLMMKGIR